MCSPCKIILNGHGGKAAIDGYLAAIEELNKRGYDVAPSTHELAIKIICGFHDQMMELEKLVINGPHVPFEHRILPLPDSPASP